MVIQRIIGTFLIMVLCSSAMRGQADENYYTNPILASGADPWIVKHEGWYYYCGGMNGGIGVSRSRNLHQINPLKRVWKAPAKGAWNSTCIWAPELHYWKGKWYIFYAAGYSGPPYIHQRTGVLESVTSDAMGEYIDKGMLFTGDSLGDWEHNYWAIDMTLLEHRGQLYAIWSGWETREATDKTQQHLYIARMENPWTMATGRVKISSPDRDYEQGVLPLNEGPQILKHGKDVFIVYSCGQSWLDTYKLSCLRLKSPDADPLNPESWIMSEKPLFEGNEHAYGVGHASFITSPDDKEYYICYHAKKERTPGWKRDVRLQKFTFDASGMPCFGTPEALGKKLPLPSGTMQLSAQSNVSYSIALKSPGNAAVCHELHAVPAKEDAARCQLEADGSLPLLITRQVTEQSNGNRRVEVTLKALEDVYFNYGEQLHTGFKHADCQFYMPGFWYRRNLRSPKEAPSFHTSDSWVVREDRLSAPLTAAFDTTDGKVMSVIRLDDFGKEALTTHREGEIILSGETSIGYTGFWNVEGETVLSYGFPYREAPKSYIRKLTLAPDVEAFQLLRKGDSISLVWELAERKAADFSECVQHTWEYCYDTYRPQPVETPYTEEKMKAVLSNFFVESYVGNTSTHYYSGVELRTATCADTDVAEVGFLGRTLLNAFNALEYGKQHNRQDLTDNAESIFKSYLQHGFSPAGFFNEVVHYKRDGKDPIHSIRRQSEGIYAVFNYLNYEKEQGQSHPEWEERVRTMLDNFLRMQNADGSFPRKFKDDFSIVDASGGSTPSATLPLVMASVYFKDKRYLAAAKRTVDYLEKELISKADYFSSTLDANCEDKEASLYAATAAYYLALVTEGEEQAHYAALAKKAAYFALSWYYVWDVPFAPGQMLGDIGLKTRGWGNVSVENNHIDVFVFEFADVLRWLSRQYNEPRFANFAEVISTSMRQLLPHEGHMCGIAKAGYYPEVVQHTNWDYGHNGKGYYNNLFAPGWTVASLWELLTPGRAEQFFNYEGARLQATRE